MVAGLVGCSSAIKFYITCPIQVDLGGFRAGGGVNPYFIYIYQQGGHIKMHLKDFQSYIEAK